IFLYHSYKANNSFYTLSLHDALPICIYYNHENPTGWEKLKEFFENPKLQLVTMSITEKGYTLTDINGDLTSSAQKDISSDPDERSEEHTSELQSRFDLVCRLLLEKKK